MRIASPTASAWLDRDSELDQRRRGSQQRRRGHLPGVVAERPQCPDLLGPSECLAVDFAVLAAEGCSDLLGADHLRLLVGERGQDRALEGERVLAAARRAESEQALDRFQVEALRLHVLDQLHAGDVLGGVVAGPRPHLGRRQQAA